MHILQELEKDGTIDNPVRRQIIVPRGTSSQMVHKFDWQMSVFQADGDECCTTVDIGWRMKDHEEVSHNVVMFGCSFPIDVESYKKKAVYHVPFAA